MGGAVKALGKTITAPMDKLGESMGEKDLFKKTIDPFGLVVNKPKKPGLDRKPFDLAAETASAQEQFSPLLERSKSLAASVAPQREQVLKQMADAATGQGPSLAEAQLKAAQDRNLSQQLAATQASRGGSNALNTRTLLQNMGSSGRDLAQQSAIDKMQERQNAQATFMSNAGSAGEEAKKDIAQQYAYAVGQKTPQQAFASAQLANETAQYQADQQMKGQLIGGAASAVGAMFSDKKVKKEVKGSDKEMRNFVDALSAKKYKYKEPEQKGAAKGEQYGVLAQALEKSKAGKNMVEDTPKGKMVDYGKGMSTILASQAALNERLAALESMLKKKHGKK